MDRIVVYLFAALTAIALAAVPLQAGDYNEFDPDVNRELSANPAQPTPWSLSPGVNTLVASASVADLDLLRINVPTNYVLSSIVIQFHEGMNRVFTGLQQGPVWTAGTGFEIDPSNMLGWVDFPINPSEAHVGVDILAPMSQAPGSIGFAPPLPSGTYSMLFQTASSAVPFALDFNVTPLGGGMSADFNGDGLVNGADLTRWKQAFGSGPAADANLDGKSDGADFLAWQRQLGQSAPIGAIPEPVSALLALLALGGAAALRRRALRTNSPRSDICTTICPS